MRFVGLLEEVLRRRARLISLLVLRHLLLILHSRFRIFFAVLVTSIVFRLVTYFRRRRRRCKRRRRRLHGRRLDARNDFVGRQDVVVLTSRLFRHEREDCLVFVNVDVINPRRDVFFGVSRRELVGFVVNLAKEEITVRAIMDYSIFPKDSLTRCLNCSKVSFVCSDSMEVFLNMGQSRPLFVYSVFSQTNYQH